MSAAADLLNLPLMYDELEDVVLLPPVACMIRAGCPIGEVYRVAALPANEQEAAISVVDRKRISDERNNGHPNETDALRQLDAVLGFGINPTMAQAVAWMAHLQYGVRVQFIEPERPEYI